MNSYGSFRASSRDTTKRFTSSTETEGADTQPWDFEGIQKWGQSVEDDSGVIEGIGQETVCFCFWVESGTNKIRGENG